MKHLIGGLLLILHSGAVIAESPPVITTYVTDLANEIPNAQEQALTKELQAFEQKTKHQLVVITIPSLNGEDIKSYTLDLARTAKVGRGGANDGLVLLHSPGDRKIRIEVGDGLEGIVTDYKTQEIQRELMIPILKQKRPNSETAPEAILAGARALMQLAATSEADQTLMDRNAAQANAIQSSHSWDTFWSILVFLVFGGAVIAFFVRRIARRERERKAEELRRAEEVYQRYLRRKPEPPRAAAERLAERHLFNERNIRSMPRSPVQTVPAARKPKPRSRDEDYSPPVFVAPSYSSSSDSSSGSGDSFSGGGGGFSGGGSDSDY